MCRYRELKAYVEPAAGSSTPASVGIEHGACFKPLWDVIWSGHDHPAVIQAQPMHVKGGVNHKTWTLTREEEAHFCIMRWAVAHLGAKLVPLDGRPCGLPRNYVSGPRHPAEGSQSFTEEAMQVSTY